MPRAGAGDRVLLTGWHADNINVVLQLSARAAATIRVAGRARSLLLHLPAPRQDNRPHDPLLQAVRLPGGVGDRTTCLTAIEEQGTAWTRQT